MMKYPTFFLENKLWSGIPRLQFQSRVNSDILKFTLVDNTNGSTIAWITFLALDESGSLKGYIVSIIYGYIYYSNENTGGGGSGYLLGGALILELLAYWSNYFVFHIHVTVCNFC